MQKKIIALAVAGLVSGGAFAQSSVTVYGVADATFDNIRASKSSAATEVKSANRVSANSSFLGFKGAEDLGGGTKAVFQFEVGVDNDATNSTAYNGTNTAIASNTNTIWGGIRDTYVGLDGGFGTIKLGNITLAARALGGKLDVNSGATGVGFQGALYGRLAAARTGVDDRTANSVAYVTPNYNGFSAMLAWGAGSENNQTGFARTTGVVSLGLNYENGPIYVGYAFTEADAKTAAEVKTSLRSNRLGAYYKFGSAGQIGFLVDSTDLDTKTPNNKRTAAILNAKYNVSSAGSIIGGIGRAGNLDNVANSGANSAFIGYEHALSKRTLVKVLYAGITNKTAANYNFYNSNTGEVSNTVAGNDPKALSVGIRHSF